MNRSSNFFLSIQGIEVLLINLCFQHFILRSIDTYLECCLCDTKPNICFSDISTDYIWLLAPKVGLIPLIPVSSLNALFDRNLIELLLPHSLKFITNNAVLSVQEIFEKSTYLYYVYKNKSKSPVQSEGPLLQQLLTETGTGDSHCQNHHFCQDILDDASVTAGEILDSW